MNRITEFSVLAFLAVASITAQAEEVAPMVLGQGFSESDYEEPSIISMGSGYESGFVDLEVVDVNNDGTLDFVALQLNGQVHVRLRKSRSYSSCREILNFNPSASDGVYQIDPDRMGPSEPLLVRCAMSRGGWTLVARIEGANAKHKTHEGSGDPGALAGPGSDAGKLPDAVIRAIQTGGFQLECGDNVSVFPDSCEFRATESASGGCSIGELHEEGHWGLENHGPSGDTSLNTVYAGDTANGCAGPGWGRNGLLWVK